MSSMEVRLWHDKREREQYESFADLYAIIKTTEKLEKAYVRDLIPPSDYESECFKLIAQFRTLSSALRDSVPSVERFADTYRLDCPAALNRLLTSGVPATIEHRPSTAPSAPAGPSAAHVAECVQHFITAMDSIRLNMVAVDQLQPLLVEISHSLAKLGPVLPPDFEGTRLVRDWIAKLKAMRASDELDEQQTRQLSFDLDSSYTGFMAAISSTSSG